MIELPDHIPNLRRLKLFYSVLLLGFCVIIARLWYLQIMNGAAFAAMAETQRSRLVRRIAARGEILDAKGRVLATSRFHYVVSVLPDEIKKNPQVLPRLAQLLQTTVEDLNALIAENRTTPFDPVPVKADADIRLLSQIEEQKLDLPGVLVTKDPLRFYRDAQVCTHVLGVVRPISAEKLEKLRDQGYRGGDTIGVEGLEATYEAELRGKEGGQRVEVDARGRMRRQIEEIKPVAGHTLRLTLDYGLQKVAYDALREELGKGHPGAAVALDPRDGAVLALVSTPSYDLNRFGEDYGKLLKNPNTPLVNRAASSFYPCGSPFKLITAAAGLETGAITPTSGDYCGGSIYLGRTWHCHKRSGHGPVSFTRAIAVSCDVFFWHVAMRTGPEAIAAWAKRFGLGAKTGIDLPPSVDSKGIVPTDAWKRKRFHQPWMAGDTLNMAIGQGFVGVTPLQMANFTAALANGGTLLRPQLVREVIDTSSGHPKVTRRLKREERGSLGLKPEFRDAIVEGMVRVMQRGGTAGHIAIPGLSIAGKTGTSEVYRHGKKANSPVFICFAPVEKPRIAIAVLLEGGGHGGEVAAPIARRMLAQYFGLKPGSSGIGRASGVD